MPAEFELSLTKITSAFVAFPLCFIANWKYNYYMSYKAFILLPDTSNITLDEAKNILSSGFRDDERRISINKDDNKKLVILIEDWKCSIYPNTNASVLEESAELAEHFARSSIEKNEIKSYSKRLEVICEDDPEMQFFNDYLTVLQELGSIKNAKVWEQAQQGFI